jgi:hypothetical protein
MSVAMQPVGEFEAAILSRAAEARRRLMGQPVKEPPRPKPPEDAEPVSRARLPHAKLVRQSVKLPRAPATYRNKATADWTPERVQKMLTMWRDGHSASEIAEELGGGITRSAVCGKAWRLRNPADAALSSRARKKQPKKANKPKSHSNIITRAAAAPKAKAVVVALPVNGISDADLVKGQAITRDAKAAVAAREGLRCVYCGSIQGPFHYDHIFPVNRGGMNEVNNLVVACQSCNISKNDRTLIEWVAFLRARP